MAKRMDEATPKRVRAGRMLLTGKRCAEAADVVVVARQTVYTWKALLDEAGIQAPRAVGSRDRPAQLDERQVAALRRALLSSPTAHGFGTELWTLKRAQLLIQRKFSISCSEVHVWRLFGMHGFSNQKPECRAKECDAVAVDDFKRKTWPALKKEPAWKVA